MQRGLPNHRRTGLAAILLPCLAWLATGLPLAAQQPATPSGAQELGVVRGVVRYQADPAKPWRLGRYYIKRPKTGELAEAVVALSQLGLKHAEPGRAAQTVTVDQKNFQFTPETVAIRAGDRVRFLNNDNQAHNVRTSSEHEAFNVTMPPGAEHVEVFEQATGIRQPCKIGCVFHSAMRSWVFVFDHPWYQLTGPDGAFLLKDVPPGEYRLEASHPAGELRDRQTIKVEAGRTLEVVITLKHSP